MRAWPIRCVVSEKTVTSKQMAAKAARNAAKHEPATSRWARDDDDDDDDGDGGGSGDGSGDGGKRRKLG